VNKLIDSIMSESASYILPTTTLPGVANLLVAGATLSDSSRGPLWPLSSSLAP
jgi:hypothetical protein